MHCGVITMGMLHTAHFRPTVINRSSLELWFPFIFQRDALPDQPHLTTSQCRGGCPVVTHFHMEAREKG